MVSLSLAREGWNNLKKIYEEGVDGLKDVFTPSKEEVIKQITTPGNLSIVPTTPQIVTVTKDVSTAVPETSLTNLGPKPIYNGNKDGKVPNDYPDWQPEETTPEILPESLSKYGKYLKYAAIGGAALLAVSVLRK